MEPVAEYNLMQYFSSITSDPTVFKNESGFLRSCFGCLASAIWFLHKQKVRHRDLKPENILIHSRHLYVTDFGDALDWSAREQSTTRDQGAPFTEFYRAPECSQGLSRNGKTDMWSVGVVFLEMVTVLRQKKIEDFMTHFHSFPQKDPYPHSNPKAIANWYEKLRQQGRGPDIDLEALSWVQDLLRPDARHRPSASSLLREILESPSSQEFCGFCCSHDLKDWDFGESSEDDENINEDVLESTESQDSVRETIKSLFTESSQEEAHDSVVDISITRWIENNAAAGMKGIDPSFVSFQMPDTLAGVSEKGKRAESILSTIDAHESSKPFDIVEEDSENESLVEGALPYNVIEDSSGSESTERPSTPDVDLAMKLHGHQNISGEYQPTMAEIDIIKRLGCIQKAEEDQLKQEELVQDLENPSASPASQELLNLKDTKVEHFPIDIQRSTCRLEGIRMTDGEEQNASDSRTGPCLSSNDRNSGGVACEVLRPPLEPPSLALRILNQSQNSGSDLSYIHVNGDPVLEENKSKGVKRGQEQDYKASEDRQHLCTKHQPENQGFADNNNLSDMGPFKNEKTTKENSEKVSRADENQLKQPIEQQPKSTTESQDHFSTQHISKNQKTAEESNPISSRPSKRKKDAKAKEAPFSSSEKKVLRNKPRDAPKRKKKPQFSPSIYMANTWEAASTIPTSVVSEKLARLRGRGIFLQWQDHHSDLLGRYAVRGSSASVRLLLEAGCDPNNPHKRGSPPLIKAINGCSRPHNKCVRVLLQGGANVNAKYHGRTPLQIAIGQQAFKGYTNLVHILIEAGADPNALDLNKSRPIMQILQSGGHQPLEKHLRDTLALLLQPRAGTRISIATPGLLDTPLHLAVRRRDYWAVGMLLHVGADANKTNAAGITPLLLAVNQWRIPLQKNQIMVLELLLDDDYGVDVDFTGSNDSHTALQRAATAGIYEAVDMLLDSGADPMKRDNEGKNTLQLANKNIANLHMEDKQRLLARISNSIKERDTGASGARYL